jgi:hypothetical protein
MLPRTPRGLRARPGPRRARRRPRRPRRRALLARAAWTVSLSSSDRPRSGLSCVGTHPSLFGTTKAAPARSWFGRFQPQISALVLSASYAASFPILAFSLLTFSPRTRLHTGRASYAAVDRPIISLRAGRTRPPPLAQCSLAGVSALTRQQMESSFPGIGTCRTQRERRCIQNSIRMHTTRP